VNMKWLIALAFAIAAPAQQVDLSILDKLSAKAKSAVNVSLDEEKLKFASAFLSSDDPNQSAAKNLVGGLKGVNVRVFEFDQPGAFTMADLEGIRSQLRGTGWSKIVEARDGDESAEVYFFSKDKVMSGITVIASEKRELAVVNIVGPIDMKTLGSLAGKFGIPKDLPGVPGSAPTPPAAKKPKP
jgi:hypothetical protein